MNEQEKKVISAIKKGGVVIYEFIKGVTEFKIINGSAILRFPLSLLKSMEEKGILELKSIKSFHSIYKLTKKKLTLGQGHGNN